MDAARESVGDKAARNLQPESTKSTGQKVEDTARDAYESVAGTVQPNSQKSAGQGLTDTLSNNDKSSQNPTQPGLAEQAMNAVGLDGSKPLVPQVQNIAADAVNSVTGGHQNPPK